MANINNNEEDLIVVNALGDHNYILPFPEIVFNETTDESSESSSEEEIDANERNEDVQVAIDVPLMNLQQATTYTTIPGVRLNSEVFLDNLHYKYYKIHSTNTKIFLICQNQKNQAAEFCPGMAFVSVNRNDNRINITRQHNHLPPLVDVSMLNLRRSIGMSATRPALLSNSVRQLYNREIIQNSEGAQNYTFLQAEKMVTSMRLARRPANPESIEEFVNILSQPNSTSYTMTLQYPPSRFFQQQFPFMAEGERVGVLFFNLDAIEKYREDLLMVTTAGVDGTFKTVPIRPPQLSKGCLLTFQIVLRNVSFPMVYALTSRMTQATYESFFRVVHQVLPLNYAQLTIMTDYERGLMNAVTSVFPESHLQGCSFHYCQSVIRYCRRSMNSVFHLFQSSPEAARVLRMVLALSHLPAEIRPTCEFTISDGFQAIIQYVNQYHDIAQQLQLFLFGYIQNFWLTEIGAERISVFESDIRTNNYLESFHSTLLAQLGKHPNVWNFLQKLLVVENQYNTEMDQICRNLLVRRHASRVQRTVATHRIRDYMRILREDGDLLMFLRRAGHTMNGYNLRQVGPRPLDP